jgi:hypothetical protein
VLNYGQVEGFIKNYRDQFHCPSQAEEQKNYPNAENSGATMYTWGPCDKGVYTKHLKLPGRGHSPSKADVSDIWNFIKQWNVNGKIGEEAPESSSSEVASSADAAKSSSSVASDNYIVVANAQGKSITVFNSLGNVVSTTRGLGGPQKVYTGAKGVYIVKVGSRTFKMSI